MHPFTDPPRTTRSIVRPSPTPCLYNRAGCRFCIRCLLLWYNRTVIVIHSTSFSTFYARTLSYGRVYIGLWPSMTTEPAIRIPPTNPNDRRKRRRPDNPKRTAHCANEMRIGIAPPRSASPLTTGNMPKNIAASARWISTFSAGGSNWKFSTSSARNACVSISLEKEGERRDGHWLVSWEAGVE